MRRRVAIGFLGTVLDLGGRKDRWRKWRPNVGVCQQDGLFIDRLELIHDTRSQPLADEVAADIGEVSPATAVRLHVMDFKNPWDFAEMYTALRDFAEAYNFDPEREDYLVNITTGTHVAQICWFLLTEAHFIPGRLLQLEPPKKRRNEAIDKTDVKRDDYAGHHSIIDLDLSRYDSIATRFAVERAEATSFLKSGIETRNAAFNAMIDEIEKVAIRSRAPVLLAGPTGAGKSNLARRVYELKVTQKQVTGPFVEVNCATLRGDQAMSTLFGHVRGAFTGAVAERAGLMKQADRGILFLDEIGELGADEQAMCLQAVEEKRFRPVGADTDTHSDFQLLAGTNRDLAARVREGAFREDLFARLNLWTFELPALSDRREDIEPNIDYELARYRAQEGINITFNREARERYLKFATAPEATWRANFRDLSASVTRMATFAPRGRIDEGTVKDEIARLRKHWQSGGPNHSKDEAILEDCLPPGRLDSLDPFDRAQLTAVLKVCRKSNSLSAAGRALFSVSRLQKRSGNDADRLRKYLQRFELRFEDVRPRDTT